MSRRHSALVGLALLLAAAPALRAQETRCERGDIEVHKLAFTGNTAFSDADLAVGIVTTPSSFLRRIFRIGGQRHCLDAREFPADRLRLTVWYHNHGFRDATVDTLVTSAGKNRINVTFRITEGEPMLVDTVRFEGLDAVPERVRLMSGLPTRVGGRFDRYAIRATMDSLARRLRDNGYPEAEAFLGYDMRTEARRATVIFTANTGPRRRIGGVVVTRVGRDGREAQVTEKAVRRLVGIQTGDLYRERNLERAKRTLYQSEAFSSVDVEPGAATPDSMLLVDVNVAESFLRSARLGGGWGTLDCLRATAEMTDYNLFRTATRLDLRGRVSKIGMGAPLDFASGLCSRYAREDPYSDTLNYYVSATLSQPSLLRASFVPTLSIYSERRSEYKAFLRTAPVGAALAFARALPRRTHTFGYSIELGRTDAQPALFCAVFQVCVLDDQAELRKLQRVAVLSAGSGYERTDNSLDPTRGVTARLDARYASRLTGSAASIQFTRLSTDGAIYFPLGNDIVFAFRARLGGVLGPTLALDESDRFVPAQERLFAGGPNTVRGYRQNELGPTVYIPDEYVMISQTSGDTVPSVTAIAPGDSVYLRSASTLANRAVPTGGNAMILGNFEMRVTSPFLPALLKWVAFLDFGRVWQRGSSTQRLQFKTLALTPGIGVRIRTPIGYLRADVAYNDYRRPAGAAYFDAPLTEGGLLYCVSPGNTLAAARNAQGVLEQRTGTCPSTFRPARPSSFLNRLTTQFAIGQAF
jgi:outer membrane protein assembly complex protein YaeT